MQKTLLIIKKLDSIYGVNDDGFPYRRDTIKLWLAPHKKTMSDSIVVKSGRKKKKRGA